MIALISLIGAIFIAYELYKIWRFLPSEQKIQTYYNSLSLDQNNRFVRINELPSHTYKAVLAAENSDYLKNGSSMANCTWVLVKRVLINSSSNCDDGIILFVANTTFSKLVTTNARLSRHIERFLLAWKLEAALEPHRVFELLLNEVYFGSRAFGLYAASETYFNKQANELTIAESALLAGILKAPTRYNPIKNKQIAIERRDIVLKKMADRGMISQIEYNEAVSADFQK